ncbi:MAG: cyanophycin synthetase, partial [Cycloclasticus sp.]
FSQTIRESLSAGVDIYSFSRRDNMAEKGCLFIANERLTKSGLSFDVTYAEETLFIKSALFGLFNIDNLVATLAVLLAKGDGFAVAVNKVQQLVSVAGRMQLLSKTAKQPSVLVDYAHTPDALKLALMSLREHCSGKLKLLFGCGGNRDQAKRALMGAIASEYADEVIISNDNPRFESAEEIAAQIKAGAKDGACLTVELDRAQAIEQLIVAAKNDDIILIAGKGHEVYQQVAGEEIPFSDAAVGLRALQRRSASLLGGGQ